MRLLDELARLWNDTLLRMPQAQWVRVPWSWPLVAAAGAALLTLVGTSSSQVTTESTDQNVTVAAAPSASCQQQTWPYLGDQCLQRDQGATAPPAKPVRVIQPDEAMAKAAIGATEWTRRATHGPNQQPTKQKTGRQKDHERDRTVTVRSGRRDRRDAAPQRVYVVPSDSAYRAYGYAPR